MTITRTWREMRQLDTFRSRFDYLSLDGKVGRSTFGFDRYINQNFYRSQEWKRLRDFVIVRDNGCDLGVEGHEIHSRLLVHHMNPLTLDDIVRADDALSNPDFLITTTHRTHNAIHYGDESLLPRPLTVRERGDTRPWPSIRR